MPVNGRGSSNVPLGKLHTERLVPIDQEIREIVTRILALRALAPSSRLARSVGPLLPCPGVRADLLELPQVNWRVF
jgi:hypothetical protein